MPYRPHPAARIKWFQTRCRPLETCPLPKPPFALLGNTSIYCGQRQPQLLHRQFLDKKRRFGTTSTGAKQCLLGNGAWQRTQVKEKASSRQSRSDVTLQEDDSRPRHPAGIARHSPPSATSCSTPYPARQRPRPSFHLEASSKWFMPSKKPGVGMPSENACFTPVLSARRGWQGRKGAHARHRGTDHPDLSGIQKCCLPALVWPNKPKICLCNSAVPENIFSDAFTPSHHNSPDSGFPFGRGRRAWAISTYSDRSG